MEGEVKEKRERENFESENQSFVKEENKSQKSKQSRKTLANTTGDTLQMPKYIIIE